MGTTLLHVCPDSTATLFGIAGLEVLEVDEDQAGVTVLVQTPEELVGCAGCGVVATGNGRRRQVFRDVPRGSTPVRVVWSKRRWRCGESDCVVKSWTEVCHGLPGRASLTLRAQIWCCVQVGREVRTVAAVARDLAVSWHTVMAAVRTHGTPLVDDPARLEGVSAIGVDEHAWQRANASRRTGYATSIVNLSARPARLLDVAQGRSGTVLATWLECRTQAWRDGIKIAALDPFRGYATALATCLPGAVRVLDAFHVVQLGIAVIDEVRRRVQQEQLGRRGHKDDPLYRIRRLLTRDPATLTDRHLSKLDEALTLGDPDGIVEIAWRAVNKMAQTYRADTPTARLAAATWALDALHTCPIPEVARLGRTLRAWRAEFLAYHSTGRASNGPTEATNLVIERNRRLAHGYRNFTNYRLRLLLHSGITWAPRPALPIRTRQTPLAA